jgi:predicted TIM-barrel fold metal-dependent hydrolase
MMPHRIDVHHHVLPPYYIQEEGKRLLANAPSYARVLEWTPAASLEAMDRGGVQTSMTSVATFGLSPNDRQYRKTLARECNVYAAELCKCHAGRFGMFTTLPMPHVKETLEEIAYGFDVLGADGVCMMTNYDNRWPGDPEFAPVFDELNRRRAVIYFHPTVAPCCVGLIPEIPSAFLEYPFDTTRAISSLLYTGTLSRCSNARFIFSHGGGTLPMLAHRIALLGDVNKTLADRVPDGVLTELRKLYFDTVSVNNAPAFAALTKFTNISQILFGSDFPYFSIEKDCMLDGLGLSDEDLRAIETENARALLPRCCAA